MARMMTQKSEKKFSLNKSRHILHTSYKLFQKKGNQLSSHEKDAIENLLINLEKAAQNENREEASKLAHQLNAFCHEHFSKNILDYTKEIFVAIILALVIAVVVRQMWFELYEIPTGSMRPTFEEQDHLTVSKLTFGINVPLETKHFYFDPSLVQRTSVVILSGDNIPLPDTDATYFGFIPYKKRYIKRAMGLPGDSLYFYGGEIYGVDKEGNAITEFHNSPWMKGLEHIPFLSFEGERSVQTGRDFKVFFKQMNQNIGRLTVNSFGDLLGEIHVGKEWKPDSPSTETDKSEIDTYSDFYGMKNYGMTRVLSKQQMQSIHPDMPLGDVGDAEFYLEIRHHPSLTYPKPQVVKTQYGTAVVLTPEVSAIPLTKDHLDAIMKHMYTARFVVKNGIAHRYASENPNTVGNIPFPGIENGTYEFYYGKGYSIGWGGIRYDLPKDHPLYSNSFANIQRLYNMGIEFNTYFDPTPLNLVAFPHRYAYFKDKKLYLLGAPIFNENDPVLKAFNEREEKLEKNSSKSRPYQAFQDYGPPMKNGKIDAELIKTFGLTIPDASYIVLGDNHAMSADSRVFGFVPQANLQGAPSLILWPPGERWGRPDQKPYPFMNFPRAIVWSVIAVILVAWFFIRRYRLRRPIKLERTQRT